MGEKHTASLGTGTGPRPLGGALGRVCARRDRFTAALAAALTTTLTAALLATLLTLATASQAAGPVEVRTLDLRLGGRETTVDLYLPPASFKQPRGAVVLAHGFTRTRATMAGHAQALAGEGLLVAVPDLPYFWHSGDNARALRDLTAALRAGTFHKPAAERIVLVGFSAGGLAALLAADAPGVVGYIGLDPFDRPSGIGLEAARKLALPAWLVRGPSSACNAFAIAQPWVAALPQLVEDRLLDPVSHCDFEAPTDWLCEAVCGKTDPARQQAVFAALHGALARLLPPTAE